MNTYLIKRKDRNGNSKPSTTIEAERSELGDKMVFFNPITKQGLSVLTSDIESCEVVR